MATEATILFSQPGTRPPVYVTTSLSGWTVLEMDLDKGQDESQDLVFKKQFLDIAEGSYQYKIRIGDHHWVLDPSTESVPDEQGNLNNVVHTTLNPSPSPAVTDITSNPHHKDVSNSTGHRKDSTVEADDLNQLPTIPVPFSVTHVGDSELPASSDLSLSPDTVERAANSDSSKVDDKADSPIQPPTPKSSEIPLLIVGKAHEKPVHDDDEATPLFRHESFQSDAPHSSSIGTIDEEPVQSSTDKTSSGDLLRTTSYPDAPPLFPHEVDDESLNYEDELDKAPLLSHENTGFSDYKSSEATTDNNGYDVDDENIEPQHYGPYDEEDDGDDIVPLLPHERETAAASETNTGHDEHFTLHGQPTFGYETDSAQQLFGGNSRPNYFRSTNNGSTLPHSLPQTDEDDDNLNDPCLERFPTNREQILERVQTIGLQFPEDEAAEEVHSPQFSVLSQACSSVELAPVRSHTSLASVPEGDYDDEEDTSDNAESPPSPIIIATVNTAEPLHVPTISESESSGTRTALSSEAKSVGNNDSTKDATSSAIETPCTRAAGASTRLDAANYDSTLRERRKGASSPPSTHDSQPEDCLGEESGIVSPAAVPTLPSDAVQREESFFQILIRVVLGPIGRFFTACAGGHRRASVSAILVGGSVVAALFLVLRA